VHSPVAERLGRINRKKAPEVFAQELASTDPGDLVPRPSSLAETYTGHTMAYHAETLMSEWGVSREEADAFAVQSHQRAAAAESHLASRINAVSVGEQVALKDDMIRPDSNVEELSGLRALFPDQGAKVTSGNASLLTDGSGAVVMASAAYASSRGIAVEGYLRGWALTAHDPKAGVLLGPTFSIPQALDDAGLTLQDIDVVEIHEAFAGQVLSNLVALASDDFAREHLNRSSAVGQIDAGDINAWGGSISLGHPFGATGARLILQTIDRLVAEDGQFGLIGMCIGGTRGAALVIERA